MKLRHLLPLTAALALAACDKAGNQQAQQLAEERAALEREKADLAAQKAAAQQAANDQERARLESERASLEAEKAKLSGDRDAQAAAERDAQIATERERRLAAERKAADESSARQAAEIRAREAQMTAEQSRAAAEQARAAVDDAAGQARATQTVDFFYDALDPYGDWVQTDRYGYAFRPNNARDPRWRPYTDGDWVHTDYGWTWRSEEPFGWATYHYGRWARAPRLGWVWVPGSEWGPAWVSWRRSDDYVGWAPLPPDAWSASGFNAAVEHYYDIGPGLYVFLRTADFGERSYRDRCVAPEQNVTIINQTVNVTRVTYQTVQNKVIVVNNGPELTFIDRASRVPVQRATVQRMPGGVAQPAQLQGNILKLSAPVLNAFKPTTKPKAVKGEVNAADLDRGWLDARQDEQKLRASSKQAALQAEEEQRVPAKKFAPPLPEPPLAKPARIVPPQPIERPRRVVPATPQPGIAATPDPLPPVPLATPRRTLPQRPVMTPPAVIRRPATPPPADPTVPGTLPIPRPMPPIPREPATFITPKPLPEVARPRPGTLQPAVPLRKPAKTTPVPAGESGSEKPQ
jgi:hypothetical protein